MLQNELGIAPAVLNSGKINAEGGRILLTASISQYIFSKAVNTGSIKANNIVAIGNNVTNSGTLNANSLTG